MKKQLLYLSLFLSTFISSSAQYPTTEMGFKLINEIADGGQYAPGIGVQTVFRFTKHSGIESGLFLKKNQKAFYIYDSPATLSRIRYHEIVFQIPLLYRFDSRLINFSAGLFFNYLLNKSSLEKKQIPGTMSSDFNRLEPVATIGISKAWKISNSWVIEPELRFSAPIPDGGVGTGFNISLRKRLLTFINPTLK